MEVYNAEAASYHRAMEAVFENAEQYQDDVLHHLSLSMSEKKLFNYKMSDHTYIVILEGLIKLTLEKKNEYERLLKLDNVDKHTLAMAKEYYLDRFSELIMFSHANQDSFEKHVRRKFKTNA